MRTVTDIVHPPEPIERQTPWGSWAVLASVQSAKIKFLRIKPGHRLSLQFHKHRSETWLVEAGEGLAVVGTKKFSVKAGDMVFVPAGAPHRLTCTGDDPLEVLETQIGKKVSERDIVRLADDYGRCDIA